MLEKRQSGNLVLAFKLLTAHGVHGTVRVESLVDDLSVLVGKEIEVNCGEDGCSELLEISAARQIPHGNRYLVDFRQIVSRNEACRVCAGKWGWVDRVALPACSSGEHYVCDLVGMRVVTANGQLKGRVSRVLDL